MSPKHTDPYQWFFPVGILFGVVGVGLWLTYWQQWIAEYPGPFHADLMMGGFFFSIAAGFLMTAAPKFSGTEPATFFEKFAMAVAMGFLMVMTYLGNRLGFHAVLLLESLLLALFVTRRFLRAQQRVPPPLSFMGFGMGAALIGSLILLLNDILPLPFPILRLGQLLYLHAMSLYLILGVGAQLLPFLMGTTRVSNVVPRVSKGAMIATVIAVGFFLQALGWIIFGRLLCATVVTWLVIGRWGICHRPKAGTVLGYMIWCSVWCLLLGLWLPIVIPAYAIHGAHVYFIGGVSLMILSVSTRVVLAHGGHGLALEKRSPFLWITLALLMLAVLTRVVAPLVSVGYARHLAYAAFFWILAIFFWSIVFLPKIFWRKRRRP